MSVVPKGRRQIFAHRSEPGVKVRHHALMATFNQQGQHVHGNQNNADTINITQVDRQIVTRELGIALNRVEELPLDELTRQQAVAELEAASFDIQAGNASGAGERLSRVRGMGSALAEVAGAFVRGTGIMGV
ncbi:hypothetical protein ACFY9F_37435 [Streptomyces sp. NPDC012421]|uniref:hypothetical protein n=1 Tax=Streptomyces sp. NPDC012421 TaxID=3364832 RepID=UPI0036E5884B